MAVMTTWRATYTTILGRDPKEHPATLALLLPVSRQLDDAVLQSQLPKPSWPRILADLQRVAKGFEAVSKGVKAGFPVTPADRMALTEVDDALSEVGTV